MFFFLTTQASKWKRGVSLAEVIIVIGILTVLSALLLPNLQVLMDRMNQTRCAGNLRQLGVAIQEYAQDNDGAVVPWRLTKSPKQYWVALLSPYLGGEYDYAANKWPIDSRSVYMCPTKKVNEKGDTEDSSQLNQVVARFRYGINVHIAENALDITGPTGSTYRKTRMSQLALNKTFILIDGFGAGQAGYWAPAGKEFTYPHRDHVNVLYLDNHVESLDRERMNFLGQNPYHVFWRGYDWGRAGYTEE